MGTTSTLHCTLYGSHLAIHRNRDARSAELLHLIPLQQGQPQSRAIEAITAEATDHPSQILIHHAWAEAAIEHAWGTPQAFIVTEGFQNWLNLAQAHLGALFGGESVDRLELANPELTFPVSERVAADGHIERQLKPEAIAQLIEKLKLNQIQAVVIGLVHARTQPAHELELAAALEKAGIKARLSHLYQSLTRTPEHVLWRSLLLNSYLDHLKTEIEAAWREKLTDLKVNIEFSDQDLLNSTYRNTQGLTLWADLNRWQLTYPVADPSREHILQHPRVGLLESKGSHSCRYLSWHPSLHVDEVLRSGSVQHLSGHSFDGGHFLWGRNSALSFYDVLVRYTGFDAHGMTTKLIQERQWSRMSEVVKSYCRSGSIAQSLPADVAMEQLEQDLGPLLWELLVIELKSLMQLLDHPGPLQLAGLFAEEIAGGLKRHGLDCIISKETNAKSTDLREPAP